MAAGAEVIGTGRRLDPGVDQLVDVTDGDATIAAVRAARPAAVVHAAAYTDVDGCERDPALAQAVNVAGSHHVAMAARSVGAHLLAVSTDFVFSGEEGAPYREDDTPAPLSVYGRTKLAGEAAVLAADPSFAVVRTAWLYGGPGKHFPRTVLRVLLERGTMTVVDDEQGSPTYVADLAAAIVALLPVREPGVFHLVNEGSATRYELARAVAGAGGLDPSAVTPITTAEFLRSYPLPARRPPNSTLSNQRAAARGIALRPWTDAIMAYVPLLAAELGLSLPSHRDLARG